MVDNTLNDAPGIKNPEIQHPEIENPGAGYPETGTPGAGNAEAGNVEAQYTGDEYAEAQYTADQYVEAGLPEAQPWGDGPAVIARDLTLDGDEGPVFGPLNFELPGRGVTALTGTGGSGRTALALVLSGRMKPTSGELSVFGETKHSAIRHRVAIAGVDQIDLLERSVTVRDVITENKAWSSRWYQPLHRAGKEDLLRVCGEVYQDRRLPPLDAYISQLSNLDKILLRIALALRPVNGDQVDMLIVDNVEQVREHSDFLELLTTFARLGQHLAVVINSVNPLPPEAPEHSEVELDTNAGHVDEDWDPGWDEDFTGHHGADGAHRWTHGLWTFRHTGEHSYTPHTGDDPDVVSPPPPAHAHPLGSQHQPSPPQPLQPIPTGSATQLPTPPRYTHHAEMDN